MITKAIKIAEKALGKTWLALCIGTGGLGIYSLVDEVNIYGQALDKSYMQYKPTEENSEEVYENLGEDYKAWITLDDSTVDYPVMQGENNETYLNHDPYGNFCLSGSIFMDSRSSENFSDEYTIIYGHHMEKTLTQKSVMFGALDNWYTKDYFKEHRNGELIVGDKKYELKVFAIAEADASSDVFDTSSSFSYINNWLSQNAIFYDEPNGNRILALSTCKSYANGERTILFCTYNYSTDSSTELPKDSDGKEIQEIGKSNIQTNVSNDTMPYILIGGIALAVLGGIIVKKVKK